MKFFILLLATIVAAAPPASEDQLVITKKLYPDSFVIYTGEHDIVDIVVPLNELNYSDDSDKNPDESSKLTIFFVEADIKDNGEKDYKGLYVYRHTTNTHKNHETKKLLENGQSTTYAKKNIVYFGAKDGIYKYNAKDQTATKYGTVTDSVIRMTVDSKNALVYYLTESYVLYKYNEDEIESTKVEVVKDARDIAFDFDGNLFYYDGNNQFYTYNGQRVLKIEGLPAHPTNVDLIRAPVLIHEVYAVIDGRLYELRDNGTSERQSVKFQAKPTAFAPDSYFNQFYAYKQKIYFYDLIKLFDEKNIAELSSFFEDNQEQLNTNKNTKVSSKILDSDENPDESKLTIFFVEADIKDNGEKDYKGLYVYKSHETKKLLENGQCATSAKNDIVYFGAKDGIYKYNAKDQTATKYGTVTDSVIRMTDDTDNAHVYYLTEDYVLYKYNEDEIESTKVEAVKDARDITFDFAGNLFYYDGNNQIYTYNGQRLLKIEGLPAHPTNVDLIRAPVLIHEVYAVIDGRLYRIKAFAPNTMLYQFYAYNQKIYFYNLAELFNEKNTEELSSFFENNKEQLNT